MIYNSSDTESLASREGKWELSGIGNGGAGVSDMLYIGFAPYENPEIAIAVVVEDTQNTYAANNLAMDVVLAYQQLNEK